MSTSFLYISRLLRSFLKHGSLLFVNISVYFRIRIVTGREWVNSIREESSALSFSLLLFYGIIRFLVFYLIFYAFLFCLEHHSTFCLMSRGMSLVNRRRKRFAASNSSCGGQTFTTTTGSTQAMSQSSTDVQLSRLRAGHNPLTEYNPNYEFGGSTSTLQDLKEIPRDKLTLIKWVSFIPTQYLQQG